jgi:hypothetical protein
MQAAPIVNQTRASVNIADDRYAHLAPGRGDGAFCCLVCGVGGLPPPTNKRVYFQTPVSVGEVPDPMTGTGTGAFATYFAVTRA